MDRNIDVSKGFRRKREKMTLRLNAVTRMATKHLLNRPKAKFFVGSVEPKHRRLTVKPLSDQNSVTTPTEPSVACQTASTSTAMNDISAAERFFDVLFDIKSSEHLFGKDYNCSEANPIDIFGRKTPACVITETTDPKEDESSEEMKSLLSSVKSLQTFYATDERKRLSAKFKEFDKDLMLETCSGLRRLIAKSGSPLNRQYLLDVIAVDQLEAPPRRSQTVPKKAFTR